MPLPNDYQVAAAAGPACTSIRATHAPVILSESEESRRCRDMPHATL
jgi:hypothetical protein